MIEFVVTALEALIFIAMAVVVFRANRNSYTNRCFSLFLIFVSVWLLGGFIDRIIPQPSEYFVTMQYRFSYAAAAIATGFFFLFAMGCFLSKKPARSITRATILVSLLMSFTCFTDMIIKRAEYNGSSYLFMKGDYYILFLVFFCLFGGSSLLLITLKWRKSRSIDRARALYILMGFGIFFTLTFILTIILPSLMDRDLTSDYSFLAVIIPAAFTAYAILRYQLLDVRLALRHSFAYMMTLVFFGLPIITLYVSMRSFWDSHPVAEKSVTIIILAFAITMTPLVRSFAEKIAARFLFTDLYDEITLLHRVSTIFTSTANIREGIGTATNLVCRELGLRKLSVAIPREIISGKGDWLVGCRMEEERLQGFHDVELGDSLLFRLRHDPVVRDDLVNGFPFTASDRSLLSEMEKSGLIAALPIKGTLGEVGVLLVGDKERDAALNPVDLVFLSHFADRLGVFIENYLLSTFLMAQLEEARQTQEKIEELDRFKTDIINVTSHEFRTPITILNGYAYILRDHYGDFSDIERQEYLECIVASCDRLTATLNQFITISRFQKKEFHVALEIMPLRELFDDVQAGLSKDQSRRLTSSLHPENICISADRVYLVMMLKNLLDNAMRYSQPESKVVLRAMVENEGVRISIRDSGVGMDSSEIRNIFNPFDRLEDIDEHQVGTGLGLYIVRIIADLMETEICVDSQPGVGTEFSFNLPLWRGNPILPGTYT